MGDYPILDYARVKLDPECDLRILTQTFGEDGYGIGIPKGSPLKVLLIVSELTCYSFFLSLFSIVPLLESVPDLGFD